MVNGPACSDSIRRGRGFGARPQCRPSGRRTAPACTPRSSDPRTATRSCWRTASPAQSGCGPTRSPTWPRTTASSRSTTAATAAAGAPAARRLQPRLPGRRPRRRPRGDVGARRARRHRRTLDGRHRDHVVVGAVPRSGPAARRRRRADQHHHRGPAAQRQFLPVPPPLAASRVRGAGTLLKTLGAAPLLRAAERTEPAFRRRRWRWDATPIRRSPSSSTNCSPPPHPPGRGGWARALVDSLDAQHIGLKNLTVPTLVIGSERTGCCRSSRHAGSPTTAPNLVAFVELPGGHCAILERPQEVNKELRALVESVTEERRASS